MILKMKKALLVLLLLAPLLVSGQSKQKTMSDEVLKNTLRDHRTFVSVPNLPADKEKMMQNINRVEARYLKLGLKTTLLDTTF